MGMFDSLIAADGVYWQTKAFNNVMDRHEIGGRLGMPGASYQVEILGGDPAEHNTRYSLATVLGGALVAVDVERDPTLPLLDYRGRLAENAKEES